METYVTVSGNLTADPQPRNTAAGVSLATLRLASNTRRYDKESGTYRDGDTMYINVTCWRGLGMNVAASLRKGDSVIATGRLIYRSYEDGDGNKRSIHELDAISVGPDLSRWAVDVRRTQRHSADAGAEVQAESVSGPRFDSRPLGSTGDPSPRVPPQEVAA